MSTATFADYDAAVRAFWAGRDLQAQKQIDTGKADAGTRHAEGSTTAVRDRGTPVFDPDAEFDDSSYTDRYRILFRRLVRERLYDATCLISSVRGEGVGEEPWPEVSTHNLTAAIAGRATYIAELARTE